MKTAIVVFPGSNCDQDVKRAVEEMALGPVEMTWHDEENFAFHDGPDLVIVPGGFSYGDYLRSGALAAKSRIMGAVRAHAERGGLTIGICNGFQILTEARLLPGALLPNTNLKFICAPCHIRTERVDTPFTKSFREGQVVQFPIAHHEGLYFLPPDELAALEARRGVVFRYAADPKRDPAHAGEAGADYAPNGSLNGIAGIVNEAGNVLGLMPHPERATLKNLIRGTDGRIFWQSLREHFEERGDFAARGEKR
jgi:phosphoribosylformylglycinamidine synthase